MSFHNQTTLGCVPFPFWSGETEPHPHNFSVQHNKTRMQNNSRDKYLIILHVATLELTRFKICQIRDERSWFVPPLRSRNFSPRGSRSALEVNTSSGADPWLRQCLTRKTLGSHTILGKTCSRGNRAHVYNQHHAYLLGGVVSLCEVPSGRSTMW